MNFTYNDYFELIKKIKSDGFQLCFYDEYKQKEFPCLLRHDIDFSIDKAIEFAEMEEREGIKSTYFVMLTSKMYNSLSKENMDKVRRIYKLGHRIGLHFDETQYENGDIITEIIHEKKLLEHYAGVVVDAVSMHEPSKEFIEKNVEIPGLINTYAASFFSEMEYCSDSMMCWKKDYDFLISEGKNKKGLQILTHPVWWNKDEKSRKDALANIMNIENTKICEYIVRLYPEHNGYSYKYTI